jgi:hypothetical protein
MNCGEAQRTDKRQEGRVRLAMKAIAARKLNAELETAQTGQLHMLRRLRPSVCLAPPALRAKRANRALWH